MLLLLSWLVTSIGQQAIKQQKGGSLLGRPYEMIATSALKLNPISEWRIETANPLEYRTVSSDSHSWYMVLNWLRTHKVRSIHGRPSHTLPLADQLASTCQLWLVGMLVP